MEFHALLDFIQARMRMAHIYQPVMIRTLLDHQGEADDEQIAKNLLSHDRSQIEYYQQITRNMVGRVLRGNDVVEREGRKYRLVGFEKFTHTQIKILQEACDKNHPNTFPIVETSSGAIVVGQSDTSAER